MKKKKHLIILLAALISVPGFISCKKGDGDPSISFYSRTGRLANDWKVTQIEETMTYKTTTVTTAFDGSKKSVNIHVTDTVVYTPTDTLFYYDNTITASGSILYTFDSDGNYQIDEAFTGDVIPYPNYTSQETGLWYFTGDNDQNETSSDELLGLAPTKYVYNPSSPDTAYTVTYDGLNAMRIFHIYRLASDEVILYYDTQETTNLYTVTISRKITLGLR